MDDHIWWRNKWMTPRSITDDATKGWPQICQVLWCKKWMTTNLSLLIKMIILLVCSFFFLFYFSYLCWLAQESGISLGVSYKGKLSCDPLLSQHTQVNVEKASEGCKEIPRRGGRNHGWCVLGTFPVNGLSQDFILGMCFIYLLWVSDVLVLYCLCISK